MKANVRYGPCLVAFIGILTSCAKHSAKPVATLFPPPIMAVGTAVPLPPDRPAHTAANRRAPQKTRGAPAAIGRAQEEKLPVGTIVVDVPVRPLDGASRIDLRRAVLDSLNRIAQTDLFFVYPGRMRVGAPDQARLSAKRDVSSELREELSARGVPASESASIVTTLTAHLTSPGGNALVLTPENPANPSSEYQRNWRIEAHGLGKQRLDLTVALKARIPSAGDVQSQPLVFSHWLSVDGGSFERMGQILRTWWPAVAGSFAGLAALLGWALWRRRRFLIPAGR